MSQLSQPFDNVYNNFVDFAWKNNILASTAGFTIGLITKDFIENVMKHLGFGDGIARFQEALHKALNVVPTSSWVSAFLHILGDFIVWIAAILLTFVVATYIMSYFIPNKKPEEKTPNL